MNLANVTTTPRMWLRRGKLDRLIAEGTGAVDRPEVARRAAQLTSARCRRGLAVGLLRLVEAAEEEPAVFSSSVPLRRGDVLANRALIQELAAHLRSDEPVAARGVALVERMLTWDGSPLYSPHLDGALEANLRHARAALLLDA